MRVSNLKNVSGRVFVSALLLISTIEVLWYSYRKYILYRRKSCKNKTKPKTEVFFFNETSALCRTHIYSMLPCAKTNCPIIYIDKIIKYILSAKKTLDVCVYFLTYSGLINNLIKLKNRNVFIRVITDDESQDNNATQTLNLRKAGIKVRTQKSVYCMHHKFAIIDKQVLCTGSANWTVQAFFGNCENVLITNESELVNAYNNEFEELWLRFNKEM